MIGTDGHIGLVLNGIQKIEDAELVSYACSLPGDELASARKHPAFTENTRLFEDFHQMLTESQLDIVGICRPYHLNAEASIAAANLGINIISEKPVATSIEELNELERAVLGNGVRITAMFGMRFLPAFKSAQKAVKEGRIGEPILATAQKSYKFGTRPEFYKRRDTYGGTIPWVAIHAVDYIRWITGLEYTRVGAIQGNLSHPDYPGCEDHGGIMFELSNGGTALVNFDYLRPEAASGHGDDRLRVAGSSGVVEITDLGTRAELTNPESGTTCLELEEECDFLVDFVEEIKGISPHTIRPHEAIQVTRTCLEARRAADLGQIVELSRSDSYPSP
jgi:predicted dehydrogenase